MHDLESVRNSLMLNVMITIPDDEPAEPDYILQPGWDNVEAQEYQHSADAELLTDNVESLLSSIVLEL